MSLKLGFSVGEQLYFALRSEIFIMSAIKAPPCPPSPAPSCISSLKLLISATNACRVRSSANFTILRNNGIVRTVEYAIEPISASSDASSRLLGYLTSREGSERRRWRGGLGVTGQFQREGLFVFTILFSASLNFPRFDFAAASARSLSDVTSSRPPSV